MTNTEKIQFLILIAAMIVVMTYMFSLQKRIRDIEKNLSAISSAYHSAMRLITTETKRRSEHLKAVKRLTSVDSIMEDMESSARTREMYDANRTVLPREDAGPPARVYTPRMRAKVPRSNYKRKKS